ncbi:MAG: DUF4258 domain-containing protein [Janthinobacterium lividum]
MTTILLPGRSLMSDAAADAAALWHLKAMVLDGARISWEIPHAREQAAERDVPVFEAERVIRAAAALRITERNGEPRWRVSGWDSDQRPIDVVVKPVGDHTLRVITVIRRDE